MVHLQACENEMTNILEQLKSKGEDVILFGASKCGMEYFEILRKQGIGVKCFADDNLQKQKTMLYGLPVFSVEQVASMKEAIILASYGPENFWLDYAKSIRV